MAEVYQAFEDLFNEGFVDSNDYDDFYQANLYVNLSSIRVFTEDDHNIDIDLESNKFISVNSQTTRVTQEHDLPNENQDGIVDNFLSTLDSLSFYDWPVVDNPMSHSYKIKPQIRYMIKEFTFYTYGDPEHPENLMQFYPAIVKIIDGK